MTAPCPVRGAERPGCEGIRRHLSTKRHAGSDRLIEIAGKRLSARLELGQDLPIVGRMHPRPHRVRLFGEIDQAASSFNGWDALRVG
jgi:hypothetical protein